MLSGELIGGMIPPGRRIVGVPQITKSELYEKRLRRVVVGVVAGHQQGCAGCVKGISDNGAGSFGRVSVSPVRGAQMKPEFQSILWAVPRAKPAAAEKGLIRPQKDGIRCV